MSKIAIVGSGISGLICAHRLAPAHEVHLFEAEHYAGGHTATKDVQVDGRLYAIDTGFIVFNDRTYPRFQALLRELDVAYQETEMSFSVNNPSEGLVYNGNSFNSLFCQRRNIARPAFLRMLLEILRFNRECKRLAQRDEDDGTSLGDYLQRHGYSDYFARNYILPMGAAIWSSSLDGVKDFPLRFFVQFFYNHGLLDISDRPQWYTVEGGSRRYVEALLARCAVAVHLATPVQQVRREADGVSLLSKRGREHFDQVILACHSDQALRLLDAPSEAERRVLGAIPYRANEVVLHSDERLLPPTALGRASWNYHCGGGREQPAAVTYSMNILQRLAPGSPSFNVTLNNTAAIDPAQIHAVYRYSHPVFGHAMVAAQQRRAEIDGVDRLHYCGAYWYNGFHEDGVRSAEDVCARLLQP